MRKLLGKVALICSLACLYLGPASADWFSDKIESATDVASVTPGDSFVVVAWNLGNLSELLERDDYKELLKELPEELSQSKEVFEEEFGIPLKDLVSSVTGNGYFAVRPPAEISERPRLSFAMELRNPKRFGDWLGQVIETESKLQAKNTKSGRVWDMTGKDGPYVAISKGWVIITEDQEEYSHQMAALNGENRMAQRGLYQKALSSITPGREGLCLFVDGTSVYRMMEAGAKSADFNLPKELDFWTYGLLSVDFGTRESNGILAWQDGESKLLQTLRRPGTLDGSSFELLPVNMPTMLAVDLDWSYQSLEAMIETIPEAQFFWNMMMQSANEVGDVREAFTGRMAFGTDTLDQLGPSMLGPNSGFKKARSRGQLTACMSNLKNLGTACEMYSTDWSGKYPENTSLLVPNYLVTIPECPVAGRDTYSEAYQIGPDAPGNDPGFQDYYFFQCSGHHHKETAENYPQYNGIVGLEPGFDMWGSDRPKTPEPTMVVALEVKDLEEAHRILSKTTEEPKVSDLVGCQSNLKNLGTACEMYSTDWSGKYPENTALLVPNYLRTMPECPAAKKDTYSETYLTGPNAPGNEGGYQDYYAFHCGGNHHPETLQNYPQYNGIIGLETGPEQEVAQVEETPEFDPVPTSPKRYDYADMSILLDPARKVLLLSNGDRAEKVISMKRSASVPDDINGALGWGQNKTAYLTYSNLDGVYNYFYAYFKQEENRAGTEALKLLKTWLGELQDVQMIAATPEGLRFRSRGYNSAPGLGSAVAIGAAIAVPNFIRARAQGQLTACKSNLKNIGTGLEMWATDNEGRYPESLDQLTPEYLHTIPQCPAAGVDTYTNGYTNDFSSPEYGFKSYKVFCEGHHHDDVDVPENHPSYNGIEGLVER